MVICCRYVLQKINGWKIYHLAAGMEDIVDMESELSKRLQEVGRKMMRVAFMQILMRMHKIYCYNITLLFSPDWSKARRSCQQ